MASLPLDYGRRPFPQWHLRCYFTVLADTQKHLRDHNITVERVMRESGERGVSFQSVAEKLVKQVLAERYFRDSRIRAKLFGWRFDILPGHLETRVMNRIRTVKENCPPRVLAVYFRSLWNGWVTYSRMKMLLAPRPCVLGCGWVDDDLGPYVCCGLYWSFVCRPRPGGLGVPAATRSKDSGLLLSSELGEQNVIRLAAGLCALYRTVNVYRFAGHTPTPQGVTKLLRAFSRRALENSASFKLLLP